MTKYQVMLLTCDKNNDLWEMFFHFFSKNWPQYRGGVFVNTESKNINIRNFPQDKIISSQIKFTKKDPWSYRLRKSLEQIDHEYVVLLMDDFFLTDSVDHDEIEKCIEYMENDATIACFNFESSNGPSISDAYDRYELKDKKERFRLNLQAAIWRKETLVKFIRDHENPWQFELWGSLRIRRYKDKIYHIKKDKKKVFTYFFGGVIADGKWRTEESCSYIKANGFDIDFEKRGVYNNNDLRKTEISKRSFIRKVIEVIKSLV